jgi:hypothetical protein
MENRRNVFQVDIESCLSTPSGIYRDMTLCTEKQHARNSKFGHPRHGKGLQAGLLAGAGHGALDETVGAGLGSIHLGVLAGVLGALVPAEICTERGIVSHNLVYRISQ